MVKLSTGVTEALASGHFTVDVDSKESITVTATDGTKSEVLYPDNDGAHRIAYTTKAK